jgi:hypothetical protein
MKKMFIYENLNQYTTQKLYIDTARNRIATLVFGFFKIQSHELFAWAGFKLPSS